MTNNAWNTPTMESVGDGKILIGSATGRPAAANITGDSNVTITNGANSISVSSSASAGNLVKISTATASASASIDFTGLSSTYFMYMIRYNNLQPGTDATTLLVRTSTNNGVSFDSGASDYAWSALTIDETGTDGGDADTADSEIEILGLPVGGSDEMGTAANEFGSGVVYVMNPSASKYTFVLYEGTYFNESTQYIRQIGGGHRLSTTAVDAVQLIMDSGTIASGSFVLYGVTNT